MSVLSGGGGVSNQIRSAPGDLAEPAMTGAGGKRSCESRACAEQLLPSKTSGLALHLVAERFEMRQGNAPYFSSVVPDGFMFTMWSLIAPVS